MDIETYTTLRGDNPVLDYLESINNEKTKKKILRNMERLKEEGFNLLRTSDIFSPVPGYEDLYELRTKFNGEHRVTYGKIGAKLWSLDAFPKKSQRLKEKDIKRSFNRLKELKLRFRIT